MSLEEARKRLQIFTDTCIECGVCENACALLSDLGLSPGEIGRAILSDTQDSDIITLVRRCDLCNLCSQSCLVNLQPASFMIAAREILLIKGQISLDDYQVMLVDQEWNFFSLYRETYGISYKDLYQKHFSTLFFPGCTLASYSPELTRATYQWLNNLGLSLGFTDLCCGKPLASIGLAERTNKLHQYLEQQMQAADANQLITACPNCFYHLKGFLPGIEVLSLYDLMKKSGFQLNGSKSLSIHDSCPDRYDIGIGKDVRDLLSGYAQVEMEHSGKNTLCCGSGGIVSMIDPDICQARASQRLAEWENTHIDHCVTACMACAHRLARASKPGDVIHVLEMAFNIRVDYTQIEHNAKALWDGDRGNFNLWRLSQSQLITNKIGNSCK